MTRRLQSVNTHAVTEVIGGILIVLIAIGVSVTIYTQMLPMPIPNEEPNVHLVGYVTKDGSVVIEHMGGETLDAYEIHVTQDENTYVYNYEDTPWEIGDRYKPPIDAELFTEEGEIGVTVFIVFHDNDKEIIFDGVLNDNIRVDVAPPAPSTGPLVLSSLRTNTPDEDIICYTNEYTPDIDASTIVYTWFIQQHAFFEPLALLQFPMDVFEGDQLRDYTSNNNGTITDAVWTADGARGGAFEFSGSEFISFPYVFEGIYADDFSIEVWVKTTSTSGTILSFGRDNYCELAISDGSIKWSTNSSDGIHDLNGLTNISDGMWHQIVVSYASISGDSHIYIDGILDINEKAHNSGEVLGSGDSPEGILGVGTGAADRETLFSTGFESLDEKDNWNEHNSSEELPDETETLFFDSFEGNQWGNWNDGGYDCSLYSGGAYSYDGSYSIHLRDDNGWSSSGYTDMIAADTNGYTQMIIDFYWMAISMESGEKLLVNYYDGDDIYPIEIITLGIGQYINNQFYHTICYVNETDYTFTDQARFVIECDASSDYDHICFDKVYVNVTGSDRIDCDLNLRSSSTLSPHAGSYSFGGTGDFDPEYAAFNRTSINLEGYTDVIVNVWYSYKDTEDSDFLGLYYKDNDNWIPIFEENNPDMDGSGQSSWIPVEFFVPDEVVDLSLQMKWMTSSSSEYVAIDDLIITGIPLSGENNYSGLLDEITIYNRVLSEEQIYQNFHLLNENEVNLSVIVSNELTLGDSWKCILTPTNGLIDGLTESTNILTMVAYPGGDV